MSGKSALSLVVTFSIFFAGCAASNTMGKPAAEVADKDKTEAATATPKTKEPKDTAKENNMQGLMSMSHGDWKKAEGHFLDTLKVDPDNYNAHMYLARVYENLKQNTDALEHYKAGIKLKPENPNPYDGLMGIYLDMGLPDNAISTADEAIKKGISEEALSGNLGWAYYVKSDLGNAEKYFKLAKERDKKDSTVRNNLGIVYFRQGRYEDALANFKEASELNKDSVVIPYFLALTYNRLGRDDEVVKALQDGVKKDPDLEKKVKAYNASFFPGTVPGDLSAAFKKLKEEKD
jgi:tetratricopeptide (TPR) repeat protein